MDLYIVVIEFDEDSVYFTEMTKAQADRMRRVLSSGKYKYSVNKIRNAPGFNRYQDLMHDFKDISS